MGAAWSDSEVERLRAAWRARPKQMTVRQFDLAMAGELGRPVAGITWARKLYGLVTQPAGVDTADAPPRGPDPAVADRAFRLAFSRFAARHQFRVFDYRRGDAA